MGVSGIVLAGGKSKRMGQDKALMVFDQETMLEHTVREVQKTTDETMIISSESYKYNLPGLIELTDIYPGMGPLGGIYTGLLSAQNDYAFVISCDMPLFNASIANFLIARREGYDVVAPEIDGHWEPLCAVYGKSCLPTIKRYLEAGMRQVFKFYPDVKTLKLNRKELSVLGNVDQLFYNINTPADYQALIKDKNGAKI